MALKPKLKKKKIALILPDSLTATGLKHIMEDYFEADVIAVFYTCDPFFEEEIVHPFDFILIDVESYVLNSEQLFPIKPKLIVLIHSESKNQMSSLSVLNVNESKKKIIWELEKIFIAKINSGFSDNQEALSEREIEVLKLVALGLQNKQIAEQLSISSHTIASHRKNITKKLGVNTVSGLTGYALINGIIDSDDLCHINKNM